MVFCSICRMNLNSQSQYEQHLVGKAHAKKLSSGGAGFVKPINFVKAGEKKTDSNLYYLSSNIHHLIKSLPTTTMVQTSESSVHAPEQTTTTSSGNSGSESNNISLTPSPTQSGTVSSATGTIKTPSVRMWCDVCRITLNSGIQANSHFTGSKHLKKARLLEAGTTTSLEQVSPTVGLMFCSFCNVHVNSQQQMDVHREGTKHRKHVELRKRPSSEPASEESQVKKAAGNEVTFDTSQSQLVISNFS